MTNDQHLIGDRVESVRWPSRLRLLQGAGLLLGVLGLAGRWLLDDLGPGGVPPGLVLLSLAVILSVVLHRARRVAVGIGLAAAVLVGWQLLASTTSGPLRGVGGTAAVAALWLEAAGVTLAVLAGLAAFVFLARERRPGAGRRPRWGRRAQVLGLLVLAPVCAEYLSAYDDSTGDPVRLVGGLLVFGPLYGCPALLIREVARRRGLGWPGMVLLAAAFGLVQAGLVDQSLFSTDYRQIEGWSEGYRATLIAPLGISAFNVLNFVGGHVIFSICAPVALVESARPAEAELAWVSRFGLAVTAGAYAAASAFVLRDHLATETSHASTLQVAFTSALIVGIVAAAFWAPRRRATSRERPAPGVGVVLVLALVLAVPAALAPDTWGGVVITATSFVAAGVGLAHGSRLRGWGVRHVAVVAAAPLLVRALLAFTYDPLVGEVPSPAKYAHNAAMLAVVLLAAAPVVLRRPRPTR